MVKITNEGRQPRAFHVASKGDFVELEKGASTEITAEDLAALKKGAAFRATIGPGALVIEGDDGDDGEPKTPAPVKVKRGRKPKVAEGETKPDDGEEDGEENEGEGEGA